MLLHVVYQKFTGVVEEHTASIFSDNFTFKYYLLKYLT
jgi:hypothetical protein